MSPLYRLEMGYFKNVCPLYRLEMGYFRRVCVRCIVSKWAIFVGEYTSTWRYFGIYNMLPVLHYGGWGWNKLTAVRNMNILL